MKDKLVMGLLVLMSVTLGYQLGLIFPIDYSNDSLTKVTTLDNCSGMDLITTSKCLENDISSFYKYNLSNIGKDLTEEQLKTEGGVCRHWSEYFIAKFESLGFMGEKISFSDQNNSIRHAIALVYNKDLSSYCVIDQTNLIGCGNLDINFIKNNEK